MVVNIEIPLYLQNYTNGQERVRVTGNNVRECISDLVKQFPLLRKYLIDADNNLLEHISIVNDGEIAYGDQLERPVKDGDILSILFIIGGG